MSEGREPRSKAGIRGGAVTEVVEHLRAALDCLGTTAPERPRLLACLALALVWTLRFEDAATVACDAAGAVAEAEGPDAAADYLAEVVAALGESGDLFEVSAVVRRELEYVGTRRDATWAILKAFEIHLRDLDDPNSPLPLVAPERREAASLLGKQGWKGIGWSFAVWESRAELLADPSVPTSYFADAGECRCSLAALRQLAEDAECRGRLGRAVPIWGNAARLHIALGEFAGMPGWIRRAEALRATLTDDDKREPPATSSHSKAACIFRREGDVWAVTWAGRTVRLRDARGFAYLAVLLRHPGRELHATDIVRLAGGEQVSEGGRRRPDRELATGADLGHAGTILDAPAQAAYRGRLADLREELAEAEERNDLGHVERHRAEIAALVQQLAGAARGRTAAAHGERARVTVSKGLKSALDRIAESHPELGKHLSATIRRGYFCVYRPDPARSVIWDV